MTANIIVLFIFTSYLLVAAFFARALFTASMKATFWTVMWFCVFFIMSLLDLDFGFDGDGTVNDIAQTNIVVLPVIYSYVGSIGAEAFIRYWDGINWYKFPNLKLMFLGFRDFNLKHLLGCLLATISYLALIRYTQTTHFEAIGLRFTANSWADLPSDFKFMLVIYVGVLFRTYIYFNAYPYDKQK